MNMSNKSKTEINVNNTYTTTTDMAEKDIAAADAVVTEAYVDRIEVVEKGVDRAVLYFGEDDEKVVLPLSMLPKNVKADDTLMIKVSFAD